MTATDLPAPEKLPAKDDESEPPSSPEPGAILGLSMRAHAGELARMILETWEAGKTDSYSGDDRVRQDVLRFVASGNEQVAHFLITGERPTTEQVLSQSRTGRAAANESVSLGDLTKLYLYWRDAHIGFIREECQRLDLPRSVESLAVTTVRAGSDSSLVRVAKQFDVRRTEVQAQLAEEQARLAHQAVHDALTGLPNRLFFLERLSQAVATTRRSMRSAVLFIDIDHFKAINDVAGHAVGDELIIGLAHRLREVLRPGDTVARLGGDEFVVLCEDLADESAGAVEIAERICAAMNRPFPTRTKSELFTSVSIGIAFVKAGDDPHLLIAHADSAMYMAKQHGRARYEIYHPDFDHRTTRRAELINGLHAVIDRGELCLYYQPVKALTSGRVVAMEALLRWNHPTLGIVGPTEFIPVAEETGLIVEIGQWVLKEACVQCRQWRDDGFSEIGVSVNVSARQLAEPTFPTEVAKTLTATGLPASALTMEVTESVLVTEGSIGRTVLDELHTLGIHLAIDDFGIGYSSLSYLARLPFDSLKVDRSFVAGLGGPGHNSSIVSTMVELAHKLGLAVVAEGVETEAELEELRRAHCDEAQGFLLCRPAPFDSLNDAGELGPRSS